MHNLGDIYFQIIYSTFNLYILVWYWFLCLMAYQPFLGYLMPKLFS